MKKVVLVRFKDDDRRDFELEEPSTTIGRRPDCKLRIPTRDVSRQHCEIVVAGDDVRIKDLGSSNGTYVNGKRIAETVLRAGDRVKIGPVLFLVQIDGEPKEIEPLDADDELAGAPSGDEDLLELDDADFDLDDPMSALEKLEDEGDGEEDTMIP